MHAYNQDLYILRQSKCESFEAPFLYLIFGDQRALLLDTGAKPGVNVYATVNAVIQTWLQTSGMSSIPLIVAHTHGHGDHVQGDPSFVGKPGVQQIVGTTQQEIEQFWGFQNYPNDIVTFDLGNRVLDVMGTPGHHPVHITVYDRETHLMLTGDIVYPGHLFVFSPLHWPDFVASLQRMLTFASQNPVEWVVGCHIETSPVPGQTYKWSEPAHPTEHVLQLGPRSLGKILRAAVEQGNDPECTIYDNFVIHPVYKCGITWNG